MPVCWGEGHLPGSQLALRIVSSHGGSGLGVSVGLFHKVLIPLMKVPPS